MFSARDMLLRFQQPRPELNSARTRSPFGRSTGFRNLPGRAEDNWLSSAFSEMVNTELAAGGELRMVPGEDVARARGELPLNDEDSLSKSTLQRLRVNPGADVVIMAHTCCFRVTPSGGSLDVRVQDTAGGTSCGGICIGRGERPFQLGLGLGWEIASKSWRGCTV